MTWLYELLDVGRGVLVARRRMQGLDGGAALTMLLIYGAVLLCFGWLWWTYDLASTYRYANAWVEARVATLPPSFVQYGPLIVAVVNAAPTLIQVSFPRLAQDHRAIMWAFSGTALFDLITDAPLVVVDVDTYLAPALAQFGPLATPATFGAYGALTIAASFVVQSLFFILLFSCWYLLLNVASIRRGRTRYVGEGEA